MTGNAVDAAQRKPALADKALKAAVVFWFLVTVIGQWIFGYYVAFFYGGSAAGGHFETWNKVLAYGYIPGDAMGNVAMAAHLFLAVIITVGGPIQLLPRIRERAPSFHRWNGRIYVLTAVIMSLTGLYRVWARGAVGDVIQHVAISLNAALIMLCAALAVRHALIRNFGAHRRWALRLFLVVSGVWFFRVGLMLWIVLNHGPAGFDPKTFQGPFLTFLSFAQYLLPLAVLELYLRTRERAGAGGRLAMAAGLAVLTAAMGVGIFAATLGMWLPHL